jgi:hypothetical protein
MPGATTTAVTSPRALRKSPVPPTMPYCTEVPTTTTRTIAAVGATPIDDPGRPLGRREGWGHVASSISVLLSSTAQDARVSW